jgi:hypothetical protein
MNGFRAASQVKTTVWLVFMFATPFLQPFGAQKVDGASIRMALLTLRVMICFLIYDPITL